MGRSTSAPTFVRVALALALITVALFALAGCLYIPQSGPKPAFVTDVGGKHSNKPIRIGASTRDDVLRRFDPGGRPEYFPRNDPLYFNWTEPAGTWVGACYPGWPTRPPDRQRGRVAAFYFDERGVLRAHKIDPRIEE
jgi:hypothetical protein